MARLLTSTLTAEQVQHHAQHLLPVLRGQGLLVLWHRRLRRLSGGGRSSGARTACWLVVVVVTVVVLPGALSRRSVQKGREARTLNEWREGWRCRVAVSALSANVPMRADGLARENRETERARADDTSGSPRRRRPATRSGLARCRAAIMTAVERRCGERRLHTLAARGPRVTCHGCGRRWH